jgi:uncharacterized tellurite resistance protein B-like protein
MLDVIRQYFTRNMLAQDDEVLQLHGLQLATAALLFELARADDKIEASERDSMRQLVSEQFSLTADEIDTLMEMAAEESRQATCLFEFISLVNEHYLPAQKRSIIEMCWHVAFSDGVLDRYEEHYIRRLADLLYVPHRDFIMAKHKVMAEGAGSGFAG